LLGSPIFGNRYERFHALRDLIGKEHYFAIHMSRGTTRSLNKRSLAPQKSFLVRIQNADQRNFRKIKAFAKQVNPDKDVEIRRAQSAQNFDALDRVDVAVQVAHFQSDITQII